MTPFWHRNHALSGPKIGPEGRKPLPAGASRPADEPRTLDLSTKTWGNDYTWSPEPGGLRGSMMGWSTPLPREGDYILMRDTSKVIGPHPLSTPQLPTNIYGTTRYQVESVKYMDNPRDMFSAVCVFAPRKVED